MFYDYADHVEDILSHFQKIYCYMRTNIISPNSHLDRFSKNVSDLVKNKTSLQITSLCRSDTRIYGINKRWRTTAGAFRLVLAY